VAGTCSISCPTDQVLCGSFCIDPLTDLEYCGAGADCSTDPGSDCGLGEACVAGTCTASCPTDQTFCGGFCVDPLTDLEYCGAGADCSTDPGTTCEIGQLCVAGTCECPAGWELCDGVCDPHPLDTDADGVCDLDDPCPLDDPDDADADGVCASDDICEGYDDSIDADADTVPEGCDCEDADPINFPGNQEICDGQDNDCDTISDDTFDTSVALMSIPATMGHAHASPYWTDNLPTTESVFGIVDQVNSAGLWWLEYWNGGTTLLDAGRYMATFRIKRNTTDGEQYLDLRVNGGSCAETVTYRWPASAQAAAGWYETPPIEFLVVGNDCSVSFKIWNTASSVKSNYQFDWIRIRDYCDVAGDCDDGIAASTDTCVNNGCEHTCI
jgi:hypothetical protein